MALIEILTIPLALLIQHVLLKFLPLRYVLDKLPVFRAIKRAVALKLINHYRGGKDKKSRFDVYDIQEKEDITKNGVIIPDFEHKLERPRDITNTQATDEVFFYGTNNAGGCMVLHFARRIDNFAELWIYLKTDDGSCYVYPKENPIRMPENDGRTFRAGGLRLECLSPLRKWRVAYNGLLRKVQAGDSNTTSEDADDIVHVKFGFIWSPLSSILDFDLGTHPSLLASIIAEKGWSQMHSLAERLSKGSDRYEQFGQLQGTVSINDEEEELYLWGARSRSVERFSDANSLQKYQKVQRFYGMTKNANFFHVGIDSSLDECRSAYGFIVSRRGYCSLIDSWHNEQFTMNGFKLTVTAGGKKYHIELTEKKKLSCFETHLGRNASTNVERSEFLFNGDEGHGIVLSETTCALQGDVSSVHIPEKIPNHSALSLPFHDPACKNIDLTGGKGSSLAQLMEASQNGSKFLVPKGLVVTAHAYRLMVKSNSLDAPIRALEEAAWRKRQSLNEVCERTVKQFTNAVLTNEIRDAVQKELKTIFGPNFGSKRFAVRSSAIGEDSEDLSAAGQMVTFLGIQGFDQICSALTKCWASQFDMVAVNYKRINGQVIDSDMAVVIQEMVPSDVAGVMFTCDPITGDPRYFHITANYGLGESVVSASADPDTITLVRNLNNEFSVHKIQTGGKKMRITMDEKGGTKEEDISETESATCCIKVEDALRLAKIGSELEEIYGSPRDTEWAISGETIYFLQARPVTSINNESDFEIMHEMNTANQTETDYCTRANVGEVMPGSMSYLFLSHWSSLGFASESLLRKMNGVTDKIYYPYFIRRYSIAFNQYFFSISEGFVNVGKKEDESAVTRAYIISLFGREIDDDELRETCSQRRTEETRMASVYRTIHLIKELIFVDRYLQKAVDRFWNLEIPVKGCKTSAEMIDVIQKSYKEFYLAIQTFYCCNTVSSMYNLVLLTILSSSSKDGQLNTDAFADFATMLSSCESVESADVPTGMTKLAAIISKHPDSQRFKTMDLDSALKWVKESSSEVKAAFEDFLSKHGHRCIKEFDFQSVTWGEDPRPLMATLQTMIGATGDNHKQVLSVEEAINRIHTPLTWFKRQILKIFLPLSRRAVGRREQGKSVMMKAQDVLRKAFHHLASQMVAEGFIPEEGLIFYLTTHEIRELLQTRSPQLMSKAKKRQRLFPEMNEMQFDEIVKGVIKPRNMTKPILHDLDNYSSLVIKGTPVSHGSIKARARVARNLKEADGLQKGEILITYSTDIGWSPYFPLISGIATELGGLMSHGAVIAREYGLPCIVGVHGATDVFKTGDLVLLDGKKGMLQRIDEDLNIGG